MLRSPAVILGLVAAQSAMPSDYGTTGLIDIPTARMQSDATLTATAAFDQTFDSYSLTFQATPWLEANFRYSGSFDVARYRARYWDRNYGFKARMVEETNFIPQMAVGVRDLIGTGVFGSEYVVASKAIGNWDLTAGIAWGRLAGKGMFSNPLNVLDRRFDYRPPATSDVANAGTIRNFYFRGDAGLFGGIKYSFNENFEVVVEYNPDQYRFTNIPDAERSYNPPSAISLGLKWHVTPDLTIGISHQHLDQVGFSLSSLLRTNKILETPEFPTFVSSLYLPPEKLPKQISKKSWYDRLLYDVERSGLLLVKGAISSDGKEAELVVGNTDYMLWTDALGEHIALADLHLPPTVETIYLVVEDGGHRSASLVVPRPSALSSDQEVLVRSRVLNGRTLINPQHQTKFATGKVINSVSVSQRLQLFDPDDPARYQVMLLVGSQYLLSNHWVVKGSFSLDLDNNFNESNRRESDSVLPNVRTGVVKYLTDGSSGIDSFFIEGRDTFGHSLHYRAFGGLLEEMFSGVGGEVLWWPSRSRFALGLSIAQARQRDYDKSFDHLDYEVMTGFLSGYWASPWYNYDLAVHAGRYLAKDSGITFELRRTFRNGWQVGLFATKTDVSSEEFGEGSFDKGFYFQVPLEGLFGDRTRTTASTRVRPVLRDGGQRLENHSGNIFWDLRQARFDALVIDERLLR